MITPNETPQQAARRLSSTAIQNGFAPEALHDYQDMNGDVIYSRIRLKNHTTGEKHIRPMHYDDKNGYVLGEPKFPEGKLLYNLPSILRTPDIPVYICEGELCVDALTTLGILATTSGSADSAQNTNWQILAGRSVIIWPDNDDAGIRYAEAVAEILYQLGCDVEIIDIASLNLPLKGDCVDWIKQSTGATKESIVTLQVYSYKPKRTDGTKDEKIIPPKISQATKLVNFVRERVELFHDENQNVYAMDLTTNENRRLDSRSFTDWLVANYHREKNVSPGSQACKEAITTLGGIARHCGELYHVNIRVAVHNGVYYLDLAEPGQSRAVAIQSKGWDVITDPPVKFIRSCSMQPLPLPIRDGDLSTLWRLVNIPESDRILVITWLLECLRPDTPFPLLELTGEQGSAKSTTQSFFRQMFDPNASNLRASPKTVEDMYIGAGTNWLVSYENMSYLNPQMQDALCILATGGGFAKRKLYTDADESVIQVKRPIILNGICPVVTAQDLIDRTVSIDTPIITHREEANEMHRIFCLQHASLLGGLMDIFTAVLDELDSVSCPAVDCPRLIEFVRLGKAVESVCGYQNGHFLNAFKERRNDSIMRTLDASPVASSLIIWFESRMRNEITLQANELFKQVTDNKSMNIENWPRSPKGFADALRRAAPALRQIGIDCECLGKQGGYVMWRVKSI